MGPLCPHPKKLLPVARHFFVKIDPSITSLMEQHTEKLGKNLKNVSGLGGLKGGQQC